MKQQHETTGQEELEQGQVAEERGLAAGGVRTKYEMHEMHEIDASHGAEAGPERGLAAGGVRTKYEMHEKNEIDASRGAGAGAGRGTVPGLEKEVLFAGTPASWPVMKGKREGSPPGG
ncbi:hypothetical protein, partial [Verrucomicrobium spinosum]|uniref:hypothetical protein n=1 Tax=Verrucomicrobium spinosum TaxID=2736 RepID=UPI0012E17EFA